MQADDPLWFYFQRLRGRQHIYVITKENEMVGHWIHHYDPVSKKHGYTYVHVSSVSSSYSITVGLSVESNLTLIVSPSVKLAFFLNMIQVTHFTINPVSHTFKIKHLPCY